MAKHNINTPSQSDLLFHAQMEAHYKFIGKVRRAAERKQARRVKLVFICLAIIMTCLIWGGT
jgi:hypothetical protein